MLRLARATGALEGNADFHSYAFLASEGSSPGEARAVIDEAIAARQIDPNIPLFKEIIATLRADRSMSREALPDLTKNALADPAARLAVRTAEALYGYGEYAKAEALRGRMTKTGATSSAINSAWNALAGRATRRRARGLKAVTGPRPSCQIWLVYVATRA